MKRRVQTAEEQQKLQEAHAAAVQRLVQLAIQRAKELTDELVLQSGATLNTFIESGAVREEIKASMADMDKVRILLETASPILRGNGRWKREQIT